MMESELSDDELLRYSRQLLMPSFDVAGQLRLRAGHVLVIGAGGLGCPVALYLGAAGVGRLTLVDDDQVELANLQRQIGFDMDRLGQDKARALCERVEAINPHCRCESRVGRVGPEALAELVEGVDLVVDASDNFATRFAVNEACVAASVPLVSGAAIRAEGQLAVFHPARVGGCYRCLYPETGGETLSCSEAGVLGPLVGMVGASQAMEALKLLAGIGEPLLGRLLILDAMAMRWRELRLAKDPACPVCGDAFRAEDQQDKQ